MEDQQLAILTGASGAVGKAAARQFAENGWSLLLCDRSEHVVEQAASLAGEFGRTCLGIKMDLSNDADIEILAKSAATTMIPVRFLGLIAGVNHPAVSIDDLKMDLWDEVLRINLRANVKIVSSTVRLLRKAGSASIVTVSSFWGREGHPYFSAYCASKAALISLTQSLAAELAPDIRVNSVAPGNINTAMHFNALAVEAEKRGISSAEMQKLEWKKIPMRRPADTKGDRIGDLFFIYGCRQLFRGSNARC